MKTLIFLLISCIFLSGCGTAINTAVAGYESNIATNEIQAGQNILNAKIFALCLTPFRDIVNASFEARQAIQAACIPSNAMTESLNIIQSVPATVKP